MQLVYTFSGPKRLVKVFREPLDNTFKLVAFNSKTMKKLPSISGFTLDNERDARIAANKLGLGK